MNGNKIDVLINTALVRRAAEDAAKAPPLRTQHASALEIFFYGMMCFDPLPGGSGYRVLFPNGLDLEDLADIPVHAAGVWVRDRQAKTIVRWSGPAQRNDFFVNEKRQLTITGLKQTKLDTSAFEGRVTNLQDCDPEFKISDNPDAILTMLVDRGTLSAHRANDAGLIVVRWTVEVEDGAPVRFTFGGEFVEIPPEVTQVFLANVSPLSGAEGVRDFQLFRKLSASRQTPLTYRLPRQLPQEYIKLPDPTFGFTPTAPRGAAPQAPKQTTPSGLPPIEGDVDILALEAEVVAQTPYIVCSAVVSRLANAA
jgi:hypothetical protein